MQVQRSNVAIYDLNHEIDSMTPGLPSYEQSLTPHLGKYSFV